MRPSRPSSGFIACVSAMANLPFSRVSPVPASPAARGPCATGTLIDPGTRLAAGLRALARELPLAVTVRGDCMAPRLRDGDRVMVAPAARYWPGDIVAFRTPQGRLALHRLLGYRWCSGRLACVTRGDRCELADSPLAPQLLLGRAAVPPSPAERARAALGWLALALLGARRRLERLRRPRGPRPPWRPRQSRQPRQPRRSTPLAG
jgi:hypothetical protein